MRLTRRALGQAAAMLVPAAALAQAPAQNAPDATQRNWLAEARESRAAAGRAIARVELPMAVEPVTRFPA